MPEGVAILPLTREDIEAFYAATNNRSVRGYAVWYQGRIACIAGVELKADHVLAFSNVAPDVKAPKLTIWRTIRELMARMARDNRMPMYAVANGDLPGSDALLSRLGFVYQGHDPDRGNVYKWERRT